MNRRQFPYVNTIDGVYQGYCSSAFFLNEDIEEINLASQEQSSNIQMVTQATQQFNESTQANAASAEELAGTAEELSNQAEVLKSLADQFKIK
jgi:methyl-accepting chemotaxis protein